MSDTSSPKRPSPPWSKANPIPPEIWAEAFAAYRAGASATVLAARYGISRNYFYDKAQRAGIHKRVALAASGWAPGTAGFQPALDGEASSSEGDLGEETCRLEAGGPGGEETCRLEAGAPGQHIWPKGAHVLYPRHVWLAARRDYEHGATVQQVAAAHGIKPNTLKSRARDEGWRRFWAPAAPIVPEPDPEAESAWVRLAHPAQLPPAGRWSTWLFQGGRGAGKTRAGAEWIAGLAEATGRGRFALVGATMRDVREVMVEGPSGLLALNGRVRPRWEPSRARLAWPNGSEAFGFSAEEPERLRGPQFQAAWCDEFAAWKRGDYALMLLRMGLRLGAWPRLCVTTTPKPIPAMRKLRAEPSCVATEAATAANAANLAPGFLDVLGELYGGTSFARQELEGVLLEAEGALFRDADLVAARGEAPPEGSGAFEEVLVAVDPPAGLSGAACGIVVAARRGRRAYVLADLTVRGATPLAWATRVTAAAQAWGAGLIVAEANQGGEMVRTTLSMGAPHCPVRLVHATRSKRARAEPVAALYEQRRVTHVGMFPALEAELRALGGEEDETGAFDRADTLVWALTVLLLEGAAPRIRRL